jgi:hypothetical protein
VTRARLGLGLVAATAALIAPNAHAATQVGMVAPTTPSADCSGDFDLVQEGPTASYVIPQGIAAPVITQWSTNAAPGDGQQLAFKVFEKVADPEVFRQVAHDGPRALTPGTLNTFAVDLPVKSGDFLGVGFQSGSAPNGCTFGSGGNWVRIGYLSDGETSQPGEFHAQTEVVNVSALVEPSHAFTIGSVERNRKKGTATVRVSVPGPGSLTLSGNGVRAQQASRRGPLAAKTVSAAGTVKLLVKAKGRKRRQLDRTGRLKVKVSIVYTPTGGSSATQTLKLKLRKS